MIKAKRLGYVDEWDRPLAKGDDGNTYCDVSCGLDGIPELWHDMNDYGEPGYPVSLSFEDVSEVKEPVSATPLTDRELAFILLTTMVGDVELIVASLILLERESVLEIFNQCQIELVEMVTKLRTLTTPKAEV